MTKLGTRFSLAIGLFSLIFSGILIYRSWVSTQRHVERLTAAQAALALEFDLAIRKYAGDVIRPEMKKRIGEDEFIVQVMSTSYIARNIFEKVRERFPEYIIKFSSDNPRNPVNLAGDEEAKMIEYFQEHPDEDRWSGRLEIDGKDFFAHLSVMRVEQSCLVCHGDPEDAPLSMLTMYGDGGGFHRRVGDVAGMDVIAIPMDSVKTSLARDATMNVLTTGVWLGLLFGCTLLVYRQIVGRRLAAITRHFRQAALDEGEVPLTPVPVKGDDEIGILASTFNTLAGKLQNVHDSLEYRVEQRTAALAAANTDLERAKEAAEAASNAKSTFLANMSHEIRTPLNAIVGMSELLGDAIKAPEHQEYLSAIEESADSLLEIINDILDFSKIEAGKLGLRPIGFNLRDSLGDTVKSLAVRAHTQGLELAYRVRPDVPDWIVTDPARLRQIVVNLVGNAIKFTEVGEVVLEVELESETDGGVDLHFQVRDTGIGISRDKQADVFEMFEQADSTTTRRFGGTGLGLAICTRLVDMMGGRIWVESEPMRGSTFHFTIRCPRGAARDDAASPGAVDTLQDLPVLVVDDNATNRRILEEMLRSWHMEPTTAESVSEALEILQRAKTAGQSFPLVLTDAHMPGTDGFTLAEKIKCDPQLGSTVIMMLTSGDRFDDAERCREIGIGVYLVKPVKRSDLLNAILRTLGAPPVEEPADEQDSTVPAARLPSLKVLLVEDSVFNRKLAVALLEKQGHHVQVAKNGADAVAAVQQESFDLVLMDVQMPEMDGFEATAAIRAGEQEAGGHVPIIAMTAHALRGDEQRCLAAGMDGYLAKPVRAQQLFDTIQRVLAGTTAIEPAAVPAGPPASAENQIAWDEALDAVGGSRELLAEVVSAAIEELPRQMAAIRAATEQREATALRHAAHTLKGSIRYFGETAAVAQALQLEQLARNADLDAATHVVDELNSSAAQVVQQLHDYLRTQH